MSGLHKTGIIMSSNDQQQKKILNMHSIGFSVMDHYEIQRPRKPTKVEKLGKNDSRQEQILNLE
jgi:archaellum biogenesis ATPase FlaH